MSDGILVVNRNLEMIYMNKSGSEICGIIPDGNYLSWPKHIGVYRSEDLNNLMNADEMPIVRALRGENLTDVRVYLNNVKLKNWKCISCNTSPISKDNTIVGAIISFRDITERLLQEERLRVERESSSKLAALGVLAAELGHEINNPLAIIRSGSWILRRILSGEKTDKKHALVKLGEIDQTIQRITDIITSVKNLSRQNSEQEMGFCSLREILQDVQSICGPKFLPKGLTLKLDMNDPVLEGKVFCSRTQISEVFINLMVNAIDAIESSPDPWVRIDVLKTDRGYIIRFTDSGPGVPQEIESRIFSAFFTTKDFGKGTGLGLSISKDIMKKHGGEISLNRNVSASCFEVLLPFSAG